MCQLYEILTLSPSPHPSHHPSPSSTGPTPLRPPMALPRPAELQPNEFSLSPSLTLSRASMVNRAGPISCHLGPPATSSGTIAPPHGPSRDPIWPELKSEGARPDLVDPSPPRLPATISSDPTFPGQRQLPPAAQSREDPRCPSRYLVVPAPRPSLFFRPLLPPVTLQ